MSKKARRVLLAVAVILFIYASVVSPTLPLRATYLVGSAAVGISVAVPSNSYNALAQQLIERDAELSRREAKIRDMEAQGGGVFSRLNATLAPYSLIVSCLLFLLVAVNYFLDWHRHRKRGYTISI